MTEKARVAVACNLDTANPGSVPIVGLLETYTDALLEGGCVPFVLPATEDEALLGAYLDMAGGVLMPGGIDVDPLIYGEGPDLNIGRLNPLLDHYQIALTKAARSRNMPIFGICRGVQVMTVAFGGTLIQHLPNDKTTFNHRQTMHGRFPSHPASAEAGSVVGRIFGRDFTVNSFHHQAVGRVAPGFAVTARSSDGVIEAIEAEDGAFCVGVQWHPERLIHSLPANLELFRAFAAAALEYQNGR